METLVVLTRIQLGIASAPVVFSYPPAVGDRKPRSGKVAPIKYDFSE